MKIFLRSSFILVVFTSYIFAQDFNLTGAGARAEGFGGAFIGLADDATAVVWNPAGLSQLERPEASLVTRFINESYTFKNSIRPAFNTDESQSHFSLNFGSVALPLKSGGMNIVAALSYQRQLDFYENSKSQDQDYDNFGNLQTITDVSEGSGGVNTITPGISAKVSPAVSVGLSVNIWTGSITNTASKTVTNYGTNKQEYKADYSGTNFVLGGLVDFESTQNGFPLKIGATVRTPFTLSGTGTLSIDNQFPSAESGSADVTEKIDMPVMIGFGGSYRIGDNLTFALDFEMRNYAQKKNVTEITLPDGSVFTNTDDVSQSGKNLNQIRLGGEYLIVLDKGVIPLRAGFKTVPTVLSDLEIEYDQTNNEFIVKPTGVQVKGTGIAFGSGFISDAFALDVTYGIQNYTQNIGKNAQIKYSISTLSSSVIIYF